jgi:single-strand DNA-binding protein
MNLVVLCGRLTKKPEIKYFTDGNGEQKPVANYTLAVDRRKKGEADFINCKAFGKLADFASNYLDKGTKIIVR